ncbi:MAG: hypothetical protein ACM30H_03640 [Clostridia bacterium]
MRITIGQTSAICANCQGLEFEPAVSTMPSIDKRYRCMSCAKEFLHGDLLLSISEQLVAASKKDRKS